MARRPGNPAARPLFAGLPVPWVTRWSGEDPLTLRRPRVEQRPGPDGTPVPTLVAENARRDRHGILWLAMTSAPGRGHALFAQLHPERQRRCMDEGRCQICGARIRPPLRFLVPETWLTDEAGLPKDRIQLSHAPVCARCAPVAQARCPHVRGQPFALISAEQATPDAVVGDIYHLSSGRKVRSLVPAHDDPRSRLLVARQRMITVSGLERRG